MTTKPPSNYGMTPLQRQDLVFLAKELPKIDFLNHEKEVLIQFEKGRWKSVNSYILFVHQLDHSLRQNEARRSTFTQKIGKCLDMIAKLLKNAHLWLQRNAWVSIRPAKDCIFSRRVGARGKIIFGYSVLFRFSGTKWLRKHLNNLNQTV